MHRIGTEVTLDEIERSGSHASRWVERVRERIGQSIHVSPRHHAHVVFENLVQLLAAGMIR